MPPGDQSAVGFGYKTQIGPARSVAIVAPSNGVIAQASTFDVPRGLFSPAAEPQNDTRLGMSASIFMRIYSNPHAIVVPPQR